MLVRNIEASTRDMDRGVPSLPSNPMRKVMVGKLKSTILSNLSYSHLQLGDFTVALKYGMELLDQKDASSSFR